MILPTTPSLRLDGKTALVTGAGRGLGLAATAALAQAGGHVTLVARSQREVERAADAIRGDGGAAEAAALDVTDIAAVAAFFAERPAFDILVNNAGTNRPGPMTDAAEADFDAVVGLNVKATFFVAQAAAKRMIAEEKPGSLIHMSSQMGHVGSAGRSLYCASKWALEGMNKAIALDLAPHCIRSNTIAPTFIETPLTAPYLDDPEFRRDVLARIKLGRVGRPEDVMGAIVYLASDAAAFVTGTSLRVDAGWTAD
jgi:NAD(P)-dependent dehydrogenase (short-subunit alcohol dehydrogenase family)